MPLFASFSLINWVHTFLHSQPHAEHCDERIITINKNKQNSATQHETKQHEPTFQQNRNNKH